MKGIVLLLASLLVTQSAVAMEMAPSGCGEGSDPEISKLRQEIAALKLDRLLDLNREQARALVPLIEQARQSRSARRALKEQHKEATLRALTAARNDLQERGVVSPTTAQALRDAHGDLHPQRRAEMRALREKAASILSAKQIESLKNFTPSPVDDPENNDENEAIDGGRHSKGRGFSPHAHHRMKLVHVALSDVFFELLAKRAR